MSNSIINTSSNTYALQDIFSDKRVENSSSDQEGIGALQNIIQSKLPSAVKAFFQTLWECIAHLKSWDESKLTVALNNANIGERCTILEKLSENLEKFDENTRDILGKFVTSAIGSNYDEFIKNSAHVCRILDAAEKLPGSLKQELKNSHVLYNEGSIKSQIASKLFANRLSMSPDLGDSQSSSGVINEKNNAWDDDILDGISNLNVKGSDINQKIEDWDAIVNGMSNFDERIQPHVRRYVMRSMLADYREISQNPQLKEQAMDVARKLPFDTSFQAELTVALNDPDCYEKVQNIDEFAINIHDNYNETFGEKIEDYGLTTTDTQGAFKGKNKENLEKLQKLLGKQEFYNYVNDSSEPSDKAVFDEFYEIFQKTNLLIDSIQRGGTIFEIGNQPVKVGPKYKTDDEDKDQWCERQTKELLKALVSQYESAQSTLQARKADYLFNFIKRFHISGNSMPGYVCDTLIHKFFSTTFANTLNSAVMLYGEMLYSIRLSIGIDKNGIMYSTTQLCFDEKKCKNFIEEKKSSLTENDINFLKHFAAAIVITTKTDLNNPDEKIDVSCYWKAGTTKEKNMILDTPTNITNPNLHA